MAGGRPAWKGNTMKAHDELLRFIRTLHIVDTHEHLPFEKNLSNKADVLSEWLSHYFSCDLVSAGLTEKQLAEARDTSKDLRQRWRLVEPYWHAAESTGYGRSLAIAARDLFGVREINRQTIGTLNDKVRAARAKGGWYARVLQEKSRIALSIRDAWPLEPTDCPHRFVFTMRADPFIMPTHYRQVCDLAEKVGVTVHTLDDYKAMVRRYFERVFDGKSRVVCLKLGLAYLRSLRYDKTGAAEAERDFLALFADTNLPAWRPGIKIGEAFQNHIMHFICGLADERGLPFQIHTGIQEGHGNILPDSNPALLSNLFLEYANVRFDLFHMSYPYMMELGTLAKNFRNVFIDMCWGHIISPEAARRALVEWLDAVPANKISAFGGDYCFVEGVYGHQALARENVAAALAQKVEDGSMSLGRAQEVARWLFVDNPVRIFALDRFMK
jgi:hypothetical protein